MLPAFEHTFETYLADLHAGGAGRRGALSVEQIRGKGGLVEALLHVLAAVEHVHRRKVVLFVLSCDAHKFVVHVRKCDALVVLL